MGNKRMGFICFFFIDISNANVNQRTKTFLMGFDEKKTLWRGSRLFSFLFKIED